MEAIADELRYPVGKFSMPGEISQSDVAGFIKSIEVLPGEMNNTWLALSDAQKDMSYRPGGWTARQVVHHVADSHMNAYIRCKLALTEEMPIIKPYKEALWAQLPDTAGCPPEVSLHLLTALHLRWSVLLRNLNASDFDRKFFHPESNREFSIRSVLALYDWHGRHHLGHLKIILNK